jgi:hypothetical protein
MRRSYSATKLGVEVFDCQSQSHDTIDVQSACQSSCQTPSWAQDQIFVTVNKSFGLIRRESKKRRAAGCVEFSRFQSGRVVQSRTTCNNSLHATLEIGQKLSWRFV